MEHTKMYHLVEPRILENLERQQGIPDPRLTKYHKLDGDMQSLLTDDDGGRNVKSLQSETHETENDAGPIRQP